MLTRIRLENFKSWEELDLELGNITIVFGTNSSGKTSALDALLLLKQTATSFDRYQPINLGGGDQDYVDFGSFKDLVFRHDSRKRVSVRLEWTPDSIILRRYSDPKQRAVVEKISYYVTWRKLRDRVVVDRLEYNSFGPGISDATIRLKHRQRGRYEIELPAQTNKEQRETPTQQGKLPGFEEDVPKLVPVDSCYFIRWTYPHRERLPDFVDPYMYSRAFELLIRDVSYLGPLREHPRRFYQWRGTAPHQLGLKGEKTIDTLLYAERNPASDRRSRPEPTPSILEEVSSWLRIMGLVDEFRIQPIGKDKNFYETKVKIAPEQPSSSLADVGFGVSQVLPVITLLFSVPRDSIVLMEQPEIHLHPCAQAQLADLFLHVSEMRGLQLIIESHSEYLLRRLQRRIAEKQKVLADPKHIRMYFCQIEGGKSIVEPVQVDDYGQISNWPKHFFGDVVGDLDAMTDAALERRRRELRENG